MRVCYSSRSFAFFSWEYFEEQQKALNTQYVELFGGTPHIWVDHLGFVIPEEVKNTSLDLVMYTPKPYNYSFCAVEQDQYNKTAAYYRNCIDAARQLGIKDVIVTVSGGCMDAPKNIRHENAVQQLSSMNVYADENDVRIHLAPLGSEVDSEAYDLKSIQAILNEVGKSNVSAMLDTAAIATHGETIKQWFEQLGDRIRIVRVRDHNGEEEVPLGEGTLPLEQYLTELQEIGFQGILSIELGNDDYWDDPQKWEVKAWQVFEENK